ncbi:potassium channel family protein [Candidatus Mycoplasma pogonae]
MTKNFLYNSAILQFLHQVAWSTFDPNENKDNLRKWVKPFKYLYAAIIAFACLVSFGTLFKFDPTIQKNWNIFIATSQAIALIIFIVDYVIHFVTYIFVKNKNEPLWKTYLRYPFSYGGIVILFCILASLNSLTVIAADLDTKSWHVQFFKNFNMIKILRLLLVLKIFTPFKIIFNVFQKQGKILSYVFVLVVVLILLFALVIWNNENTWLSEQQETWIKSNPGVQDYLNNADYQNLSNGVVTSFWNSLYATTITLTTIGYGDFTPHSDTAKFIVMIISVVAVALIAIPSGVIAGAFLQEIQNKIVSSKTNQSKKQDSKQQNNSGVSE